MHKGIKTIVATIMAGAMLASASVPAMAAEQTLNASNFQVSTQTMDAELAAVPSPVGEFHYTGRLTKGKVLGTVQISEKAKTVQWTVGRTGGDGWVILRITHKTTGEIRRSPV